MTREQVHGAISKWFDRTDAEHHALIKPYAISSLGGTPSHMGVEVSVLTPEALVRLLQSAVGGRRICFGPKGHGGQTGQLGRPVRREEQSWGELNAPTDARSWELEFLTPTHFRRGDYRSSPWPAPAIVLRGLSQSWGGCSQLPRRDLTHQDSDCVWVSDIAGHSERGALAGNDISGFVGRVRYRCDDARVAAMVDPLFRLAPFCGVGSAKAMGLGVTRLRTTWRPRSARNSTRTS